MEIWKKKMEKYQENWKYGKYEKYKLGNIRKIGSMEIWKIENGKTSRKLEIWKI